MPATFSIVADLKTRKFIGHASQGDIDGALANHKTELEAAVRADQAISAYKDIIDVDDLMVQAVTALYKQSFTTLDDTGLVIAGFGATDYFPSLHTYNCYGMVLGKLIYEVEEERDISQENVSEIVPLAQSEMAKGFMHGLAPSMSRLIDREVTSALDGLGRSLATANLLVQGTDTSQFEADARNMFSDNVRRSLEGTHTAPMKRVVGMLPVDELAELAEIFVKMESLKERVTRGTEEVSGPIDVAVITKGDGFIWIKRKHYFDPGLNPRYFSRRGMTSHE